MTCADASVTAVFVRCVTFLWRLCSPQVRLDVSAMQRTYLATCALTACLWGSNAAQWHRKEPRLRYIKKNPSAVIPAQTRRRQITGRCLLTRRRDVFGGAAAAAFVSPVPETMKDAANETLRSTLSRFLHLLCVCTEGGREGSVSRQVETVML